MCCSMYLVPDDVNKTPQKGVTTDSRWRGTDDRRFWFCFARSIVNLVVENKADFGIRYMRHRRQTFMFLFRTMYPEPGDEK